MSSRSLPFVIGALSSYFLTGCSGPSPSETTAQNSNSTPAYQETKILPTPLPSSTGSKAPYVEAQKKPDTSTHAS